jgi:Flp pilus assembly protein TadG
MRWLKDIKGVAAAEFAIVATVVLVFVTGIVDIGSSIQQRMALQQAVRAAGLYAQSFPSQTTGITNVVAAALPGWSNISVSCQNGSVSDTSGCATSCGGGTIDGSGTMVLQVCRPFRPFLFPTGNCTVGGSAGNCASYVIRYQ